jgi:alcohol dehydrogenase (cytochrome c)
MRMSWSNRLKLPLFVVALLVVGGGVLAGCGSSSSSSSSGSSNASANFTGDAPPGIDLANTRMANGPINSGNVSELKESWSTLIKGQGVYGSYASTPVIVNGVVYSQDLESNVQALDLESGDLLWSKQYESPSHGPNGLAVAEGHVYGTTAGDAFALDQKTGKELWSVSLEGSIDMAPGANDGKVYVSTVPETPSAEYEAGAVGTLWALDGKSGKKLWHFDTVPKDLWGNPGVNSGGGVWYPPSFDKQGNVYVGTGNPAPLPGTASDPWGSSRPGDNRYADSMVKLDPDNGKMLWYYQETPHNIYDWDFQDSPVLTTAKGKEVAVGAGKSGFVVAIDTKTGKPVWRQAVGTHNGHDKDPEYAMRGEYKKIKTGEVFPGQLGGVVAPLATDGKLVFAPVVNHSMTVLSGSEVTEESSATGEVVALDLASGKVVWNAELRSPAYGGLLVSNDVVFATEAGGVVHALKADSGGELWQAALPSGTNAGVMVSGDMMLAGAGLPLAEGQLPKLVAYKLGG